MTETTPDGGGKKYIFTADRGTVDESTNDTVTTVFNFYLVSGFNLLPELSIFCLSACEINLYILTVSVITPKKQP